MNNEQEQTTSVSDLVITAIEHDKVVMRPKWHFILGIGLLISGTVLMALTVVFVVSFIFFSLRQNGSWFVSDFGLEGWQAFIVSLPWMLLVVAIIFIVILGLLVKKYSFAYGRPLLYSALGIVIVTSVTGFLISLTSFHSSLLGEAENQHLPIAGVMYRQYGHRDLDHIVIGRIMEKNQNTFALYSPDRKVFTIIITPRTIVPQEELTIAEVVVVLGDRQGNTIKALGIKRLTGYPGMRAPVMPPRH